jgi:hypothetical protein
MIEGCIGLISPTLQMGGGKKNTHGSLVMVEHMCAQTFPFPNCWCGDGKQLPKRFGLI